MWKLSIMERKPFSFVFQGARVLGFFVIFIYNLYLYFITYFYNEYTTIKNNDVVYRDLQGFSLIFRLRMQLCFPFPYSLFRSMAFFATKRKT